MNPFAQMTGALTTTSRRQDASLGPFPPMCKANILREHLRRHGPCTAAELGCLLVDTPATRASALLVNDIRAGRIEVDRTQWPRRYSMAAVVPLNPYLLRAIEQLQNRGYEVIAP
jgi:hypothetical protein